jgi:hypothetical protein
MKNADIKDLPKLLFAGLRKLGRYSGFLLFLLIASIYVYVVYNINSLSDPTIDQAQVIQEATALPVPQVDDDAAKQLQTLQDNSVSVQTLFEQGRTDPFFE